jgi:hypothetical protein
MTPSHVVVVPSTLLLLPGYAGRQDPIPELRGVVHDAVAWLVERHPDEVCVLSGPMRPDNAGRGVTEPAGERIGRQLLSHSGFEGRTLESAAGVLVVANGSACRSEKAPGHLDERSFGYDAEIEEALRSGSSKVLRDLDASLGEELWAYDVPALTALGELVGGPVSSELDYADDPYGVRYWVARWTCAS